MRQRILIVLSALLLLLSAAGCKKKEMFRTERTTEFKKFALENLLETAVPGAFAVSDDGELFLSENWEKICRYSADGTLLATYGEAKNAKALCLMGRELFVYTYENQLLRISTDDGKMETLAEQMPFSDVQNLVAAGAYLYAHVIDGGMESGLKRISPTTGAVEDVKTAEGTMRAVYASADGCLYYCMEQQGSTFLYEYQEKKKKSTLRYDITNRLEIYSAVQTFVCEQGIFLYTTMTKDIFAFSLTEERYACIPTDGTILFGQDIVCAAGNVVYRTFADEAGEGGLHTVYLGSVELKQTETAQMEGTIVVRTASTSYGGLDVAKIKQVSGLQTKVKAGAYRDGVEYSERFLAELMAGNPDVDIYVIGIGETIFCREGMYEPLNSSRVIQAYKNACFPYISEEMETETGDIWMLPIAVDMYSLWYVEENLEKFGVNIERLRTMESFLELSKEMKERLAGTEYYTYANAMLLGDLWDSQYIRVYNDVSHGIVNYKTEAYRKFFDAVWTGWINYSQSPEHPYIERWRAESSDGMYWEAPQYRAEKMLYKFCGVAQQLKYAGMEGWRVMPAPKFSEEVPGDTVSGYALVLNPHSRQKDLAMAYLEAVAENPVNIYQSEWTTSFLFADRNVYRGTYDMELPAFQDLYQLFSGGSAHLPDNAVYPYYYSIVDDYQNGKLTLDEALDTLQRGMDMYLNE